MSMVVVAPPAVLRTLTVSTRLPRRRVTNSIEAYVMPRLEELLPGMPRAQMRVAVRNASEAPESWSSTFSVSELPPPFTIRKRLLRDESL